MCRGSEDLEKEPLLAVTPVDAPPSFRGGRLFLGSCANSEALCPCELWSCCGLGATGSRWAQMRMVPLCLCVGFSSGSLPVLTWWVWLVPQPLTLTLTEAHTSARGFCVGPPIPPESAVHPASFLLLLKCRDPVRRKVNNHKLSSSMWS